MTDNKQSHNDIISVTHMGNGFGANNAAAYSVFHGLNALGGIPPLPNNTDNQGFTFFTKPCLNLSYNNVVGNRKLAFLADPRPYSMGNLIRCMLNPPSYDSEGDKLRSSIIDDKCAFLPISNLLMTMQQPPDIISSSYTSNEGYNKEQVTFIDSKPNFYEAYDLTLTFANLEGDPISTIFSTWMEYAMRVYEGSMLPFPINIVENRIDYETRIYRFVMDRTKTFIQRIYSSGPVYPVSVPLGAVMGFDNTQHLSTENNQISITMRCMGAMYDDPILILEFNKSVTNYNKDMLPKNRSKMIKVNGLTKTNINKKSLLNYKMYPWISETMELEWYAYKSDYDRIVKAAETIQQEDTSKNNTVYKEQVLSPWEKSNIV
jgi:hypothetical protein